MVNFPYRYVPVPDSVGGLARHDRSPGWWLHKTCSPVPRSRRCAALHQKKGGWNLNSDIGDIYYVHICICIYIDIWRGYLISYIYRHIPNKWHRSILTAAQFFMLWVGTTAIGESSHGTRSQVVPGCSPIHSWGKHPILKQVTLP